MTHLETQLRKNVSQVSHDLYMERLKAYQENEWLEVRNSPTSNDFYIFRDLADHNLVAMKRIPLWNDGHFKGHKIVFLFNWQLKYE